jgi:8-oxo-dGTP pyrophosphatase MutT (NUDIX family)
MGRRLRPGWLVDLEALPGRVAASDLSRFLPPPGHTRRSAVLILFGAVDRSIDPDGGPEVLLTERARTLRAHAGQVAFPGGLVEPGESDAEAALREAAEETGVDPAGIDVIGVLPTVYLPVSDYSVAPVLGFWHSPSAASPLDAAEVARAEPVPVAELADPVRRFRVVHPSGFTGPGFWAREFFVWGFTAGLLDRVLALAGWELPWDNERVVHLERVGHRLVPRDLLGLSDLPGTSRRGGSFPLPEELNPRLQ